MADRLLDEFPPVSKAEWLAKIQADLKGKPYEKLVRISESGIPVAPVYMAADLPAGVDASFPGMDDLRRGESPAMRIADGMWRVFQDFNSPQAGDFGAFAAQLGLEAPAERIGVRVVLADGLRHALTPSAGREGSGGVHLGAAADLDPIVDWAITAGVPLCVEAGDAAFALLETGLHAVVTGGLDLNPLAHFREGKADEALPAALLPVAAEALRAVHDAGNDFKLFTIHLQALELAGANAVQQVAFAIAQANDLVARLSEIGMDPSAALGAVAFQYPVGTDFFGEIAKLRAHRVLWGRVLAAWGASPATDGIGSLFGKSSLLSGTVADPYVNLLRHTTEAMAAALGGCGGISVGTHDEAFQSPGLDALRIAKNIQHVLRDEAYLNRFIDPVGGSYFGEYLTDATAQAAWALFQSIEAAGGWYAYAGTGQLEALLAEGRRKRAAVVQSGQRTVLGTNQFPNEKEKVGGVRFAPLEGGPLLSNVVAWGRGLGIRNPDRGGGRLSAAFEGLRRRVQALSASAPGAEQAVLLTFGDLAMRGARANFARNVLAAGGFQCTENPHPGDKAAAVDRVAPSVAVLCAADADYLSIGAEWLSAARRAWPDTVFLLAGRPEGWEALQAQGIWEPIHAGMDRLALLQRLIDKVAAGKGVRA